jgi:14-3-3 protein epsilon
MLLLVQVQVGMQIENIPLIHSNMWVQIHNLPMGLMKENVGVRLANYIGSFVEYDKNNGSSFWRQYMRVRVKIDVRKPLKKDTKVMNKEGKWCTVNFKYEKLGIFCFVCGAMGHAENKCEIRFGMEQDDGRREWPAEIRADSRRQGGRFVSRWLREEKGSRQEHGSGEAAAQPQHQSIQNNTDPSGDDVSQVHRYMSACNTSPNQPTMMIQSMTNHNARNTMSKPSSSNYSILSNPFPNGLTVQSLALNSETVPPLTFNATDNNITPLPTIPDFLPKINSQPVTIHIPVTEKNAGQSLTPYTLTFNSQPTKQDPPKISHKSHKKYQPGANNLTLNTRPRPTPLPNPKNIQPRPEKKTKTTSLNPTQNSRDMHATLEIQEIMEFQGEKKRRREEEENASATTTNDSNEHF